MYSIDMRKHDRNVGLISGIMLALALVGVLFALVQANHELPKDPKSQITRYAE